MDYKRVLNAFCGAADITLCGLPHAEGAKYVPPTAEVTAFAIIMPSGRSAVNVLS